jgi:hypothetical protein
MKFNVKAFCVAVACCGLLVSASAQINLLSNSINFRTDNNSAQATMHYGDLHLEGGTQGSSWGWLYCNKVNDNGELSVAGAAYIIGTLSVQDHASFYNGIDVYGGTKNFIQPHPTDTTKAIRYICIESGEALTLARGTAKTVFGVASIDLPEHFGLVTSDEAPLTVLLTPENAPVLLYTAKKTKSQIIVNMKKSDFEQFGDAEFAWQVTGVRDGFENQQVIVDIDDNGSIKDSKVISGKRAILDEKVKKLMNKQAVIDKKKEFKK